VPIARRVLVSIKRALKMAKAVPGVTTQNLKPKAPHKHDPLPELTHKPPPTKKEKAKGYAVRDYSKGKKE
jgi:hypothetical protein